MLVGGLANTSFVGLPMIEAFYGTADLPIGILIDQLGTYLVLSTLGIAVAAYYGGRYRLKPGDGSPNCDVSTDDRDGFVWVAPERGIPRLA